MKGADLVPGETYAISRGRKLSLGDAGAWKVVFVGRGYVDKNDFSTGKKLVVAVPKLKSAKDNDGGFAMNKPIMERDGTNTLVEVGREWRPMTVPYKNVLGTWEDHEAAEVVRKESEAKFRAQKAAEVEQDQAFRSDVAARLTKVGLAASVGTGDGWGNRQRRVIFEGTERIEALLTALEA